MPEKLSGPYADTIRNVVRTNMYRFPKDALPTLQELEQQLGTFAESLNGDLDAGRNAIRTRMDEIVSERVAKQA